MDPAFFFVSHQMPATDGNIGIRIKFDYPSNWNGVQPYNKYTQQQYHFYACAYKLRINIHIPFGHVKRTMSQATHQQQQQQ